MPTDDLKEKEDTGIWKKNHWIALCGELAMEVMMGLWQESIRNEWTEVTKIKSESGKWSIRTVSYIIIIYFSENSDYIEVNIFHPS